MTTASQYTKNNILVIPQSLEEMSDVSKLGEHQGASIYYKCLERDLVDVEFYTNTPCIVFIEEGQETLTTSNNEIITVDQGTAIFLPQGQNLHSDYVATSGSLKAYLVFLNEFLITQFLSTIRSGSVAQAQTDVLPWSIRAPSLLLPFFEAIQHYHANDLLREGLFEAKLLELLQLLASIGDVAQLHALLLARSALSPKRNLIRLLQREDILKLSVADLAKLSGRSLSSFSRDFKNTYNQAPKQWLQERRLNHARKLLESDGISVTEAALTIGYENISHFIKAFKKQFDVTPSQIKN